MFIKYLPNHCKLADRLVGWQAVKSANQLMDKWHKQTTKQAIKQIGRSVGKSQVKPPISLRFLKNKEQL